ncbi:hypothetical protein ACLOJK_027660 [Asimina triloba]
MDGWVSKTHCYPMDGCLLLHLRAAWCCAIWVSHCFCPNLGVMRKEKSGPEMDGGTAAGRDLDGSDVDRDPVAQVVDGGNGDRGRVVAGGSSKSDAGSGQMGRWTA